MQKPLGRGGGRGVLEPPFFSVLSKRWWGSRRLEREDEMKVIFNARRTEVLSTYFEEITATFLFLNNFQAKLDFVYKISGSHGGEYEDDSLL
jgi:hypothetical protein